MTSVLHVALIAPNGYSNEPLMNAFLNSGFTSYHCFDYQLETFNYGRETMRRNLIRLAEHTKPDLIFLHVQSSEVLDFDTVIKLSAIGFTVLYTFDCRTTEQTEWMYNYAKHLGLVCFSNQDDVQECLRRDIKNVMTLQSSCDMDVYCKGEPVEKSLEIVFIGGNYVGTNLNFPLAQERKEMVDFLEDSYGDYFTAMGNGWGGGRTIKSKEEIEMYRSAAIAINQNNFNKHLYTSDRLWRIMATGTFCLTRYFDGIEKLFQRKVHLDWWHTFDEMEEKIDYYVTNVDLREQIAKNGMYEVRYRHTWTDRVKEMMVQANQLKPKTDLCRDAHRVKGEIPVEEHYHNAVCDCGKFKYSWEECCGGNWALKMYQNI